MLDKIQPLLVLNYERQIGRAWTRPIITNSNSNFSTGQVDVFYELIVPSVSEGTGANLTACANAIYTAAREANMSLSEYGHLDPVKFVFAAAMLGLLFEECKRDIRCINNYEFGNRTKGDALVWATSKMNVADLLDLLPSILMKMDMLGKRINSLYIPAIAGFADWLPHRVNVYRDDEGSRYQLYLYRMRNYYYLETDPTSANVGQLIYTHIPNSTTLLDKLDIIEKLLSAYEADDDFVNFATEAVKAGLPRLQVNPVAVASGSSVGFTPVDIVFDIDDICSLENAYYVTPAHTAYVASWSSKPLTWDIRENTVTGKFEVGKVGNWTNRLPVMHPFSESSPSSPRSGDDRGDSVSRRPIFTHAQISSEYGLYCLTRYMACVNDVAVSSQDLISWGYSGAVIGYYNKQGEHRLVPVPDYQETRVVTWLDCHSTQILNSIEIVTINEDTAHGVDVKVPDIFGCYIITNTTSPYVYFDTFRGFKFTPYLYAVSFAGSSPTITEVRPLWKDYDYITSLSVENLNQFFSAHLWNSFVLLKSTVQQQNNSNGNAKKKDKSKGKGKGKNKGKSGNGNGDVNPGKSGDSDPKPEDK